MPPSGNQGESGSTCMRLGESMSDFMQTSEFTTLIATPAKADPETKKEPHKTKSAKVSFLVFMTDSPVVFELCTSLSKLLRAMTFHLYQSLVLLSTFLRA